MLNALLVAFAALAPSVVPVYETADDTPSQGKVDELVFGRLKELKIRTANLCNDEVFVRRAFLDVIGTLPTPDEVRTFVRDSDPAKHAKLIDALLARPEFADYWAMKWGDLLRVKAEFPINLWPNAVQAYHRWIRTCVKENVPYDRFVREMLVSNGSNFRVGPVNFYRAMQSREPQGIAQTVALTFMGSRLEKWPKDRQDGMTLFFSQISQKATAEWKEEILFFDPAKPLPANVKPIFPDGTPAEIKPGQDPREVFAAWLIRPENPFFTRAIVNRAWSWLLGRGIVHEADDIRADNRPSNPELLAYLEKELVAARYDMKRLFRLILTSKAYRLSSIPQSKGRAAEANFAYYPIRRLEAEVLIDALNQITGTHEIYTSAIPEPFTYIPEKQRSIALADGSITSSFLELFGRPSRDTGMESERSNRPSAAQRLHLLNSSHVQKKIEESAKLAKLLNAKVNAKDPSGSKAVIEDLYLTVLSRSPTEKELKIFGEYAPKVKSREALIDLTWALINSSEFLYRH